MSNPPKTNYVDGERLCELAAEAALSGHFSDDLMTMFYAIAQQRCRLFESKNNKLRLGGLDFDDMVQEAVMLCFQKTPQFAPAKMKHRRYAFYFFKRIVDQCFIRLYEHANRQKRRPDLRILNLDGKTEMLDTYLKAQESSELSDDGCHAFGPWGPRQDMSVLLQSLTQDDDATLADVILDMRQQHDDGRTYKELADGYGVSVEIIEELILRGTS